MGWNLFELLLFGFFKKFYFWGLMFMVIDELLVGGVCEVIGSSFWWGLWVFGVFGLLMV